MTNSAMALVRAAFNVTTVDGIYVIRGTAGEDCPTGAPIGGRLVKRCKIDDIYPTIRRWEGMGRTITEVNVYNYGTEIRTADCFSS